MADPLESLRLRLVSQVRGVFHDASAGQTPTPPSDEALFARDTPIRQVHADIVGMMTGGVRALLLQMLHPHALQGVLDHSNFREDMHGRLRRTARFIAVTTFGHRDEAMKAIERVNRIHAKVGGTLPDGTAYQATNPRTLAWVHVTEAQSFLAGYIRHVRPAMTIAEQDEYYRQFAVIARALGADPVPETRAEADRIFRELARDLVTSSQAREVAQLVLSQRPPGTPVAVQTMITADAVAMLPGWAAAMLNLQRPVLTALPTRAATWGMGRTLRWAFRQDAPRP
jgi:uncharacterized protein (DUF2236 family)